MENHNITIKDSQVLITVDSELFKELLDLAIYAKKQLKINDSDWYHSPKLYEEMLKNHEKIMQKAIHLPQGNHEVLVN